MKAAATKTTIFSLLFTITSCCVYASDSAKINSENRNDTQLQSYTVSAQTDVVKDAQNEPQAVDNKRFDASVSKKTNTENLAKAVSSYLKRTQAPLKAGSILLIIAGAGLGAYVLGKAELKNNLRGKFANHVNA